MAQDQAPLQPGPAGPPASVPVAAPAAARSQTLPLLVALVCAIAGGLLARRFGVHGVQTAQVLGQLGQLWLNGQRMPLVPLIFCLMATGVASIARTAAGGAVARIAIAVFAALLLLASVLGALIALGLTALWPIAALRAAVPAAATAAPPSLLAEFVSLVPSNPIGSAAEGAMAPLIVFAAIFGAATLRLRSTWATLLLDMLNAIAAAMLVIIGWVLRLAPIGIFCLLFATVTSVGTDAATGMLQYCLFASIVPLAGILIVEAVGLLSGVGPSRFARAALAPQTLAATTQSSTACLPALLEAATALHLPPPIVAAIMPLAVATFRFGNVIAAMGTGLFGANLFGIHPSAARIAAAAGIGILTNVGSVGVPGAAVLFAAWGPVFLALGAPLEALTLYVAVITVPDILITTANVTGDLAATSLIASLASRLPAPEPTID
jgi:proton glutamate symport protein